MKRLRFNVFLFAVAFSFSFSARLGAQSIIPNGGFEQWDSLPPFGFLPLGWTGGPLLDTIDAVFQSADAHSGNFALGERVISIAPNYNPGARTADTIINGEPDPFVGFPITGNPIAFEGWYKFSSVGGDRFEIDLGFQNSHTNTGVAIYIDSVSESTYTYFSVSLSPAITDSGMGTIWIDIHGDHIGTELLIDDLALTGGADIVAPTNSISFHLDQNYPNPFNSTTTIRYSLPTDDHVRLEILNMLGERVTLLEDGNEPAGEHQIFFDGDRLASAPYLCRLITTSHGASSNIIQLSH